MNTEEIEEQYSEVQTSYSDTYLEIVRDFDYRGQSSIDAAKQYVIDIGTDFGMADLEEALQGNHGLNCFIDYGESELHVLGLTMLKDHVDRGEVEEDSPAYQFIERRLEDYAKHTDVEHYYTAYEIKYGEFIIIM